MTLEGCGEGKSRQSVEQYTWPLIGFRDKGGLMGRYIWTPEPQARSLKGLTTERLETKGLEKEHGDRPTGVGRRYPLTQSTAGTENQVVGMIHL